MDRRIASCGAGSLGATHAAFMAETLQDVLGVDVHAGKPLLGGRGSVLRDRVLKSDVGAGRLRPQDFTAGRP